MKAKLPLHRSNVTKADLSTNGYFILDEFLSDEECEQILAAIV